ncbi:unnamed protein product [Meganyctiphanes norvegica]|uniref:Nuclear protein MDM1 n=1 Tax=Meganyctiphanes norvegica TaxID=48144 RepID=A0AAV2PY52_MEGNR
MNEMLSSCWFTSPFTGCFNAAIKGGGVGSSSGMQDSAAAGSNVRVSQSEERQVQRALRPSPRSRSEGPLGRDIDGHSFLVSEYKTQYAWVRRKPPARAPPEARPLLPAEKPPTTQSKRDAPIANGTAGISSSSRGHVTIAAGTGGAGAGDDNNEGSAAAGQPRTPRLEAERERIIGGGEMLGGSDEKVAKRVYKSEYRKKFRPFSQYQYVDGKFQKSKDEPQPPENSQNWYKEVIELRKQAGQYRARQDIGDVWRTVQHRGWGVETASDRLAEIYSKQAELWEQVSRRSSLQALSLASATPSNSRPISKAEKDIENSRRSSPIKHVSTSSRERPSTAPPKPKTQKSADKTDGKSSKETTPRHHYDKTTGSEEEGLLITSPSRDKLEPFIPEDSWSSRRSSRPTPQVTSPNKDGKSRSRVQRAASAARPPPSRDYNKSSTVGRSVSVGPENRSPKRTSRPPSSHAPPPQVKPERRPRPSEETENKKDKEKEVLSKEAPKDIMKEAPPKDGPKDTIEAVKDTTGRKSTPEPRFDPEKYEPVVKTPPEPTRVKSPDQVGKWAMVKSPDPVNWTVPLDTGKTFTVTHNIPEATHCLRIPRGESARGTPSSEHGRHILDSGKRQTPEPTKINTGSLAGTPVSSTSDPKPSIPVEPKSSATKDSVESKSPIKEIKSSKDSSIKPAETKSSDSKPSDSKPVDTKETATKPSESKPKSPEPKVPDSKSDENKMPESRSDTESKTSEDSKKSMSESQQDNSLPSSVTHISPEIPMPLSSGTVDPMSMSMFGSLNGMNGNKSSGSPSPTKPEVPLTASITTDSSKDSENTDKPSSGRNVPGTNLRCLDDPSFTFDSSSSSATKPQGGYKVLEAPAEDSPAKPSAGYRVLEAPGTDLESKDVSEKSPSKTDEPPVKPSPYRVLEAPMEPTSKPKGSPYRVLEAPDAPYYPQAQSVGAPVDSKPPSLVSPTSGRAVTEHLDKARSRFDSFWGGPKDDPPSNV